jgi:hypothetical protein
VSVGEKGRAGGRTVGRTSVRVGIVVALAVLVLVGLAWAMGQARPDPDIERLRGLSFQRSVEEAQVVRYDDLYHQSGDYEGALVFYEGLVRGVDGGGAVIRAQVTPPRAGHPDWEDVMVFRYDGDEQFEMGDIIGVVALSRGLQEYERDLGGSDWLPTADVVQARYLRRDDAPR